MKKQKKQEKKQQELKKQVRLSEQEYQKQITLAVADRSTCLRRKVGASIWKDGRLISTGYNGAPRGLEHCSDETCNDKSPCQNTIHAEANAICNASYFGVPTKDATIIVTLSPCKYCAGLIINAGISEVLFISEYRDNSSIELLKNAGVKVGVV